MLTDWELLDRFAATRDQPTFAELVSRHVDVVYGIARRVLGGPGQEAQDVTQAVFLLLSQKARTIPRRGALSGWLFKATRYCCANTRKGEGRRKRHEQGAAMLRQESIETSEDLQPILDQGLAKLSEKERQAILVRYFEKKTAAVAGETLGISPEAVEKRLERGIGRLRQFFSAQGYDVPASSMAAILIAEQANAAPLGLAAMIGSGAHVGLQAAAIAKLAGIKMFWAKVSTALLTGSAIVAAPLVSAAVITIAISNPAIPATRPAVAVTSPSSTTGGRVRLARWDVLMNKAGADRIKAVLEAIPTASTGYDAFKGDAEKLRLAVLEGKTAGEILDMSEDMRWGRMQTDLEPLGRDLGLSIRNLSFSIPMGTPINAEVLQPAWNANVFDEPLKGALQLRIETIGDGKFQMSFDGKIVVSSAILHMNYTGEVPVGQSVVFLGDVLENKGIQFWHLSVWQAFRCNDTEWVFVGRNDSLPQWINVGFEQERAMAQRPIAWNAHATQTLGDVSPKWERKLPNGVTLRLIALSMPNQWPDCWWDGDGKPVHGASWWTTGSPRLFVVLQAEDLSVPLLGKGDDQAQRFEFVTKAIPDARISVGIAVGAWKPGPRIKVGQTVECNGAQITLNEVRDSVLGGSDILATQDQLPEMEMRIAAYDKNGAELTQDRSRWLEFVDLKSNVKNVPYISDLRVSAAAIDHLMVLWRPIANVEFANFSTTPLTSPNDVKLKTPMERISPDPNTPEGFRLSFIATMAAGDSKKVLSLIAAETPAEKSFAEMAAECYTAYQVVLAATEAKFGVENAREALVSSNVLPQMERPQSEWHVDGDRAILTALGGGEPMSIGPFDSLVRIDGQWRMALNLSAQSSTPEAVASVEKAMPTYRKLSTKLRELSRNVAAGKFPDADAVRGAMQAQINELSKELDGK